MKQKSNMQVLMPQKKTVTIEELPEEAAFIRSSDVCKLLNISNSTLKNLRAANDIPYYKLRGVFLYSKEEILNYMASKYSPKI